MRPDVEDQPSGAVVLPLRQAKRRVQCDGPSRWERVGMRTISGPEGALGALGVHRAAFAAAARAAPLARDNVRVLLVALGPPFRSSSRPATLHLQTYRSKGPKPMNNPQSDAQPTPIPPDDTSRALVNASSGDPDKRPSANALYVFARWARRVLHARRRPSRRPNLAAAQTHQRTERRAQSEGRRARAAISNRAAMGLCTATHALYLVHGGQVTPSVLAENEL